MKLVLPTGLVVVRDPLLVVLDRPAPPPVIYLPTDRIGKEGVPLMVVLPAPSTDDTQS